MVQAPPSPPSSSTSSASSSRSSRPANPPKVKGPLTVDEIGVALDASVKTLFRLGYAFSLFGSAACSMYGMDHRCPHDIDIIVLSSSETCEEIKSRIARADHRFTLIPARNPKNQWNVMWFTMPGRATRRRCKIDVLTPGTIGIPRIPPSRVHAVYGIPLTPVICLLLLKLQSYFDHHASDMKRMQQKIPEDIVDIAQMARLAAEVWGAHVDQLTQEWYSSEFKATAFERVRIFAREFPETVPHWETMGFVVAEPAAVLLSSLQGLALAEQPARKRVMNIASPTIRVHA